MTKMKMREEDEEEEDEEDVTTAAGEAGQELSSEAFGPTPQTAE